MMKMFRVLFFAIPWNWEEDPDQPIHPLPAVSTALFGVLFMMIIVMIIKDVVTK